MIRVVIADDHHLVREGIRALLEKAGDIEVVGEATDGLEAVERAGTLAPDVVIMDIAMPHANGIQAVERLRALNSACRVVMLSMYSDDALVRAALQHGARGFVLKGSVSEELLLAVRAASRGGTYLSPAVSDRVLAEAGAPSASAAASRLTRREAEVLRLISEGRTNSEIADDIGISVKTVERHRTQLMAKLGARNLVQLIRISLKQGLIRLDD